ncbi:carbon storage regulator CsrA [Ruminiclostridium cellobioparum]|uniref:carbon storage regulator CsrA n=1 Tax=Ruminiclostridium cellobioparum TaxID=29355 RepID=UPI00048920EC|nr:carbon storage regulator CsrA [Ruminiclostridium cellobioparum]
MLVLSRKKDQGIIIGENIELTIIEIQGDQVRIGIKAPKNVPIYREEIFLEIQNENKKAANTGVVKLEDIIKKKD